MRITHATDIEAPAERVWALTTAIEDWPALMPTVTALERLDPGPLVPGSRARIDQPGLRPAVWTVVTVDAPHTFVWGTKLFGVRTVAEHHISATPSGCRNELVIEMVGRGSGLLGRLAKGRLAKTLATENGSFRRAAEA